MNILLIEDEPKIAEFIQKGLGECGYGITLAYDGKTGLDMALQRDYDVVIMDVMLPYMNGLDVCSTMRNKGVRTPVLMLSALGRVDDKVEGFQRGADDYLVKPFHFKELVARLNALVRRPHLNPVEHDILAVADVLLNRSRKTASRGGREISLTAREYNLLEFFMMNSGRLLSRSVIAERVWGQDFDAGSNIIDVYINYLRNKLEKNNRKRLIHTMIGMGYIMKED